MSDFELSPKRNTIQFHMANRRSNRLQGRAEPVFEPEITTKSAGTKAQVSRPRRSQRPAAADSPTATLSAQPTPLVTPFGRVTLPSEFLLTELQAEETVAELMARIVLLDETRLHAFCKRLFNFCPALCLQVAGVESAAVGTARAGPADAEYEYEYEYDQSN